MTLDNDQLEVRLYIVAGVLGGFCGLSLFLVIILVLMHQTLNSALNNIKVLIYTQQEIQKIRTNFPLEYPALQQIGTGCNPSSQHHTNDNSQELNNTNLNRKLRNQRMQSEPNSKYAYVRSHNPQAFSITPSPNHNEDYTHSRETSQTAKACPPLNRPGNSNRMFETNIEKVGY